MTKPGNKLYIFPAKHTRNGKVQVTERSFRYNFGKYESPKSPRTPKRLFREAQKQGRIYVTSDSRYKGEVSELQMYHSYEYGYNHPSVPGWSIHEAWNNYQVKIPDIYDTLVDLKEEVRTKTKYNRNEMLTKAYANANERDWDILTELAELPSTIKMGVDFLKALRNPLRTLKNLDLASKKKKFKVVKEQVTRTTKSGKTFTKTVKRRLTYYEFEGKPQSLAELSAQAWLVYRYGIMPLVFSFQDAAKALSDVGNKITWETVKSVERTEINDSKRIGEFGGNHAQVRIPLLATRDARLTQRVMVKTRYNVGNLKAKKLGVNPVSTLWELIPFSFVADWVVNVGDVIMALTPTCYEERALTYSEQVDVLVQYEAGVIPPDKIEGDYYTRNVKGRINWSARESSYRREVVSDNALSFVTLPTGLELNWKRQLDAFALAYVLVKPDLSALNTKLLTKSRKQSSKKGP